MKTKSDSRNIFILYFTILMVLTISCNNQSQSIGGSDLVRTKNSPQHLEEINAIRLKYTTGIRSILEDSKGNVWFGIRHMEYINLKAFPLLTTERLLSDNCQTVMLNFRL